jgi:hypothetical protein
MLEDFQRRLRSGEFIKLKGDPTHRQYNEVIIEATAFLEALPTSIEAFFFPDTPDCATPQTECQAAVHAAFLQEYGLSNEAVPLLRLRASGVPAFEMVD